MAASLRNKNPTRSLYLLFNRASICSGLLERGFGYSDMFSMRKFLPAIIAGISPTAQKVTVRLVTGWLFAQILTSGTAFGQVLTHGPVVGGVTASSANIFVRTDQAANVALRYGTDPSLETYLVSETFPTSSATDFTKIIPLANLTAETTYYMNVVVDGVPQFASSPYPSFT